LSTHWFGGKLAQMGPVACFDKSFLQSLSVDESVWFDQYFTALIPPLFFVETLADLEKQVEGRNAEDEVARIATKTPEMSGSPNVFHSTLCNGELRGFKVPMTYRPVLGGGKQAEFGEKKGYVFSLSPEAEAWGRWKRGDFREIERLYAKAWREMLASPVNTLGDDFLQRPLEQAMECKTLGEVLSLARMVIDGPNSPYDRMKFVFEMVPVKTDRDQIYAIYRAAGFPPLRQFAPYTAHVLDVEIFCRLALKKGLISAERASNRVDVAYLNYLPFCQIFVSGDNLHRRTVPLFLSCSQTFVWGPDLKADLKRINELHQAVPEEIRVKGIHAFAAYPPKDGDFLTAKLWDQMNNRWRDAKKPNLDSPKLLAHIQETLRGMRESAASGTAKGPDDLDAADALIIDRSVSKKRGSWYQMPKDLT
jgi:hypothetical protein